MDYLQSYYENYDEDGRLLSRHGQVEYLTTMKYIDRHLHSGMRILEIGAGTGRYSHALARKGYAVDAVELMQHNIDIFSKRTTPGENISIRQGNAIDLSFIDDAQYDMVLLLGPMYHLYTEDEQKKALTEALRVLKPGGLLYTAYCISDATIFDFGFRRGNIHDVLQKGLLDIETFTAKSTPAEVFQLYRQSDAVRLMAELPCHRLHYVGTDMYTNYMRQTVDEMDDATFDVYLQYHFCICERADMVGLTHHSLDIVQKDQP